MSKAKDIALIGVYIALVIGAQVSLGFLAGVEIVTVLVAAFCYYFGLKRSLILVNAFSLLRCVIYGFFPTVVILYLVYYNVFAAVFSGIGRVQGRRLTSARHAYVVIAAVVMTACFTLLDDLITPMFYKFSPEVTRSYVYLSLYTMAVQCVNALATVLLLFRPILGAFRQTFGATKKHPIPEK